MLDMEKAILPATPTSPGIEKLLDHKQILEKTHKDKLEVKEHKFEKFEIKEYKREKLEYEYVAGPAHVGPGDPVEQRLASLEATMAQLLHFIPESLRPDLSQGALKQEADVKAASEEKKGATEQSAKEDKKR
jgi:hypothetical protein